MSVRSQICQLLGDDPYVVGLERRPSIEEALCARPDSGIVVPARDGTRDVALVILSANRAFAVADRCPHDGGLLSDGYLDDGHLVCARHGWEFDPRTGACVGRGSVAPLCTRPVVPAKRSRCDADNGPLWVES